MKYDQLKERAIYCQLYDKLEPKFEMTKRLLLDKFPDATRKELEEGTLRNTIAKHIMYDLIDLSKWCYGPEWIGECHTTCWDFLHNGFDALPEKYLDAQGQGAFFKYDPKASVEIVMMPRGVGKTFTFSALRALQELIQSI